MKLATIKQLMAPLWDVIDILSFIQELLTTEAIVLDGEKDENVR